MQRIEEYEKESKISRQKSKLDQSDFNDEMIITD